MNVMLTVGAGKGRGGEWQYFGLYRVAGTYQVACGYLWVLRTSM